MLGKRFLSLLLALGMLLMLLPAAAASELTMLQVDFLGMYATSAGTYESRKFTGDFTVMQNGEAVGTTNAMRATAILRTAAVAAPQVP